MKFGRKALTVLFAVLLAFGILPSGSLNADAENTTTGTVQYAVSWASDTTVALKVTPTNKGTVYYVVQESGGTALSKSDVLAGTAQSCTGGQENGINLNVASTNAQDIYLVYQDEGSEQTYDMSVLKLPARSSGGVSAEYGIEIDTYDPQFPTAVKGDSTTLPAAKTLTIRNTGSQELTLSVASGADHYDVTLPAAIAAGATATLTVQPKAATLDEARSYDTTIELQAASGDVVLKPTIDLRYTVSLEPAAAESSVSYSARWTD